MLTCRHAQPDSQASHANNHRGITMLGDTIEQTYDHSTKMIAATLAAARCSAAGITKPEAIVQEYIDLLSLVSKAHERVPYTAPPRDEGR
jgi:hypothetical protein